MLGDGKVFDTNKYFVVCMTVLGTCYGATSPLSAMEEGGDGKAYKMNFPDVSVRDSVKLQLECLSTELGVKSIKLVVGGSFGGMQTLEYVAQTLPSQALRGGGASLPEVRSAMPISCGLRHTGWQIGISECQRQSIYKDPRFNGGEFEAGEGPEGGLAVARMFGMLSYRSRGAYADKFARVSAEESENGRTQQQYGSKTPWIVKSYLEYQGSKFLTRFDPITYVKLTEQMDSHDIYRNRPQNILDEVTYPISVLGIDSDLLYPVTEQVEVFESFTSVDQGAKELIILRSDAGHDGFLLEQEDVGSAIERLLKKTDST
jgi:homoserine O-acetyltransferase